MMRYLTMGISLLCAGFFSLGLSLALLSNTTSPVGSAVPMLGALLCVVGYVLCRPALKASKAARKA